MDTAGERRDAPAEIAGRLDAVLDTALAGASPDTLLDELIERVRRILAADTAAILLLEGDELVARATKGLDDDVRQGVRVPVGHGFAGRVAAEKRPVILDDVRGADLASPTLREKNLRTLLGVPILFEGRVIGVLHVGTVRPRAFGHADAQLLQIVADRVGLGIAYARLEEIERRARAEADEARREFDDFFEQAAVGIHWVGPGGIVLRVNQAELDLLGYRREEYVGHHVAEFHADREVADDILVCLARGETVRDREVRLRCKDGSIRHVLVDSNARWEAGRFLHTRCFTRDVTERKRAEQALRESEERYRRIVEIANEGVWLIDAEARTRFANARMAEMLGCTAEELPGRNFLEFVFDEDRSVVGERIGKSLSGGSDQFDLRFRRKDGSEILVLAGTSPVIDTRGNVVGVLGMFSDITARKRAEVEREQLLAAAQQARTEAEAANRAKDQFLAVLSHELRSPLGAIRTWASLLRSGKLGPEKAARAAEAIERNVITQTRLIEDLLDVSRISSGKLTLEVGPVDLAAVIDGALDAVREPAAEKELRLEKRGAEGRTEVLGDPARLQQVTWNLLSNAVKFSRPGGRVLMELGRDAGEAVIAVTDEGEGIAPELLPHVFESFRQGDSSSTRSHGGLGLGLAIVRHLAELHGGSVFAESEGTDRGARFTVRLPLLAGESGPAWQLIPFRPALSARPFEARAALAGIHILLVEDDPEARESVAAVLEASGATVTRAASAREGLDALQRVPADLLLSDLAMPGEDGYALIRAVRALPPESGGTIPAVALTAFASAEDRVRALAAGFQTHLAKPVDAAELVDTATEVLAAASRATSAPPPPSPG